jgi:hypothetical protein
MEVSGQLQTHALRYLVYKQPSEIWIQIFYTERELEVLDLNICRRHIQEYNSLHGHRFVWEKVAVENIRTENEWGDRSWGKLRYEELHDLYSSSSLITRILIKSRRMRLTGHAARMEKMTVYRILVRNSEGKRPLGRPRRRCVWILER